MNIRMPSINRVMISGNLVDEPRTDLLENGTHVANFRLASSQSFRGRDGEWHEKTCFVDVVAWRRTAELVAEYLRKGSPVLVEGELQTSSWQAQDGSPRSRVEIVARRVQFLERPGQQQKVESTAREEKAPYTQAEEPPDSDAEYDDIPF